MFDHLRIDDPTERRLVGATDLILSLVGAPGRVLGRIRPRTAIRRILLLRLERIGDLLMTIPAIQAARDLAPEAAIDLVVGSWNAPLAGLIPGVDRFDTMDVSWLARESTAESAIALGRRSLAWRKRHYDLAINFEGDIRSHLLMYLSGAARRVGFDSGGGGPTLTDRVRFDVTSHTSVNALALIARAFAVSASDLEERYLRPIERFRRVRLTLPSSARAHAEELLREAAWPIVAVHASGGRAIKQWPPERFGEVCRKLALEQGATILLTGSASDRELVDQLRNVLPAEVRAIDLTGKLDLATLAAVLERVSMLVTGDTGPMHLADAMGTPVVAVFGLSDPRRYRPLVADSRVVRIDLPCSPCNRVRRPPARCTGHTPDCLRGIHAGDAVQAALDLLRHEQATMGVQPESSTMSRQRA